MLNDSTASRLKVLQLDVTDESQVSEASQYVTQQLNGQGSVWCLHYYLFYTC